MTDTFEARRGAKLGAIEMLMALAGRSAWSIPERGKRRSQTRVEALALVRRPRHALQTWAPGGRSQTRGVATESGQIDVMHALGAARRDAPLGADVLTDAVLGEVRTLDAPARAYAESLRAARSGRFQIRLDARGRAALRIAARDAVISLVLGRDHETEIPVDALRERYRRARSVADQVVLGHAEGAAAIALRLLRG